MNRGHNIKYTVEPYIFVNIKNIDYIINKIDNISIIMVDLEKGKKYNKSRIDKWCTLMLSSTQKEFLESLKRMEMENVLKDKLREKVEVFNKDEDEIAI